MVEARVDEHSSELTDTENISQFILNDRVGAGRMESTRIDGTRPVDLDWEH